MDQPNTNVWHNADSVGIIYLGCDSNRFQIYQKLRSAHRKYKTLSNCETGYRFVENTGRCSVNNILCGQDVHLYIAKRWMYYYTIHSLATTISNISYHIIQQGCLFNRASQAYIFLVVVNIFTSMQLLNTFINLAFTFLQSII